MKINLKRKTRNLEKLKKKINDLSSSKVKSGYYDGGIHPTANLPYAEMMAIHEYGMQGNVKRPVRQLALHDFKNSYMRTLSKDLGKYFYHGGDMQTLLSGIGTTITYKAQSIFGNSQWLTVTSNPTPLIDTGQLKMNWTWSIE